MKSNQNETRENRAGGGRITQVPSGFTLVELLVVITIISILTGLLTVAVANALRKAKQAAIVLELQQLGGAIEDFKNEYSAYPPNAFLVFSNEISSTDKGKIDKQVQADLDRMFKKAFPRANISERQLFTVLVGGRPDALIQVDNFADSPSTSTSVLTGGMTASEAIVFWLSGFSSDPQYPISGPGGPSYNADKYSAEPLEDRNRQFEFDLGRLGPRDDSGSAFGGRSILYEFFDPSANATVNRRINLWRYTPGDSEEELVYFDVSRQKLDKYDIGSPVIPGDINPDNPQLFALKKLREGVDSVGNNISANATYVNQGKFQILHCGVDDAWGDFNIFRIDKGTLGFRTFPEGPFIGDIADNLTHFTTGSLAEEQE